MRKPRYHPCLNCEVCGRQLIRTQGGYWACPLGHGGLRLDAECSPTPMFPDDEPTSEPGDLFGDQNHNTADNVAGIPPSDAAW